MQDQGPTLLQKTQLALSFFSITVLRHDPVERPHWNEIVDGLFLGAIPIETQVGSWGNHGKKIRQQCKGKNKPLGLVVSVMEDWELDGYGLCGLQPVTKNYWESKKVAHQILPLKDFKGDIPLATLKDTVECIDNHHQNSQSVYIHCKAGRGRSFAVVMCYLMDKFKLDMMPALELVLKKRYHVSPSSAQFQLIENYRKLYLPTREGLVPEHPAFRSFRKDWLSFMQSPMAISTTVGSSLALLSGPGLLTLFTATFAAYLSDKFNVYRNKSLLLDPSEYEAEVDLSNLNEEEREAFDKGLGSNTFLGWLASFQSKASYYNYEMYLEGQKTAEHYQSQKPQ